MALVRAAPGAGDRQMVCCAAVPWAARPRPHVASSQGNVDIQGAGHNILELETRVKRRLAKVSVVSYVSLMIIASVSQFHVYLPWGQHPFSKVT